MITLPLSFIDRASPETPAATHSKKRCMADDVKIFIPPVRKWQVKNSTFFSRQGIFCFSRFSRPPQPYGGKSNILDFDFFARTLRAGRERTLGHFNFQNVEMPDAEHGEARRSAAWTLL